MNNVKQFLDSFNETKAAAPDDGTDGADDELTFVGDMTPAEFLPLLTAAFQQAFAPLLAQLEEARKSAERSTVRAKSLSNPRMTDDERRQALALYFDPQTIKELLRK